MNIKIITVNFGNTDPTNSLVESLSFCQKSRNISIAIADNNYSIKSKEQLNKIKDKSELSIEIFSNEENLFYWPAAKKIITHLKVSPKRFPDWILICNNDITFIDNNFFKELENIDLNNYPIIGPNIINKKGDNLNPFMVKPFNFISNLYWRIFFTSYLISKLMLVINKSLKLIFSLLKAKNKSKEQQVYSVHGSAILFSSGFFNAGGWFDDNFELYGEELTVSEIAKKNSIPIFYVPRLKIMHNEHSSTKKTNKRLLFDKARASYYYINSTYLKK